MTLPTPATLRRQAKPFDDPDWLFEIKHDGFRALAILEHGKTTFMSRNGRRLNGFGALAVRLARSLPVDDAILDGEIAVSDKSGRTVFATLMQHRAEARFYAFDLPWLNGQDLRAYALLTRKERLKNLLCRRRSPSLIYVDHLVENGTLLYEMACQQDLEGIVAKRMDHPYPTEGKTPLWIKITNPAYTLKHGRGNG